MLPPRWQRQTLNNPCTIGVIMCVARAWGNLSRQGQQCAWLAHPGPTAPLLVRAAVHLYAECSPDVKRIVTDTMRCKGNGADSETRWRLFRCCWARSKVMSRLRRSSCGERNGEGHLYLKPSKRLLSELLACDIVVL